MDKMERQLQKAQEIVNAAYQWHIDHNYDWLTSDVAHEYRSRAEKLGGSINDTGARRQLREELQSKYGLTTVEATNILSGYHISEYVEKYRKISERIPTFLNQSGEKNEGDVNS